MRKSLLLLSAIAVLPLSMSAQELKEGYIKWPDSQSLATYVKQWNGGSGAITMNGEAWEDQEFFTSRVKPRARFTNTATQVYPERLAYDLSSKTGTDKRLCYWVPVSDEARNGVRTNALPNGLYDQEVFNMWSYVDHYGDWNTPWGWTPGAFADAAHKNGVGVSGVASVPYGGISAAWKAAFEAMGSVTSDELGKFLYYFGQDGLGYNSEFSGGASTINILRPLHDGLKTYMSTRNPNWEVMWYAGTNDNGSINFDTGIGNFTGLFNGASMFLNYNWNNTSYMSSSVAKAKELGLDPFRIYAGMNMQGGEPRSGSNYTLLKDYQYSIGLWAGHNNNILWKNRQNNGSNAVVKQAYYNKINEMLFGNGKRNPAIKQTITDNRSHFPNEDFAGYSSMMNARSTLSNNLASDYFYTFFNLGNGQFFNWKGNRMHDNQWYNIGVQDYLPTWRFWFAPTWLQNTVEEGTTHLSAEFTWEDAYVGGSCLKIEGSTETEYLHLFKTQMSGLGSKVITVRYKLLAGSADVRLVLGSVNNPGTEPGLAAMKNLKVLKKDESDVKQDISYKEGADGWVTVEWNSAATWGSSTNMPGGLGVIGLEFKNAENMKLLLGEISILPKTNSKTPTAPVVKSSKILANNFSGLDGKIFWTMDNDVALKAGTPKYNSDVNASVYKVWVEQEGEAVQMNGITTSWAAFVFRAAINQKGSRNVRLGVSAVSADTRSESEITWGEWLTLPDYEKSEEIMCSKTIIKVNEKFEIGFVDSEMPEATWQIFNNLTGDEVWTGTGRVVECPGLAEEGAYDVKVTYEGVTKTYNRYIPITSTGVGALPEIYTLSIDGNEVTDESADIEIALNSPAKKFSYTGRYADGKSSRGLDMQEKWFGVRVGDIGLDGLKSFSIAAWVRFDKLPDDGVCSNFFTIEDRIGGGWPFNNWGYFWSRINSNGGFTADIVDTAWGGRSVNTGTESERWYYSYKEAKLDKGFWAHVALVFEYNAEGKFRQIFYINGKKQLVDCWVNINKGTMEGIVGSETGPWSDLRAVMDRAAYGSGTDTYEPEFTNTSSWPVSQGMWINFGGSAPNITAMEGSLDDFQIWGKAMTESDVLASMNGLDKNNLPAEILGFWDFESDAVASTDYSGKVGFVGAVGANATKKTPMAYWHDIGSTGESSNTRIMLDPNFQSGCPYLSGEAYPIVTTPKWETRGVVTGSGTGEAGSADITFPRVNDYTVELQLSNGHGTATAAYPVVKVTEESAINGVEADMNEVNSYVINGSLFVDFAEAGNYNVKVFNTIGMLQAEKSLNAAAGQTATITLGTSGIYLVKIVKDGRELRTVKVIRK